MEPYARKPPEKGKTMRTQERRVAEIQFHWNTVLTRQQREQLYYRFSDHLDRLFEELGLTVMCNDCLCRFEEASFAQWEACPECGSWDLDGHWGNPVLQAQHLAELERESRWG